MLSFRRFFTRTVLSLMLIAPALAVAAEKPAMPQEQTGPAAASLDNVALKGTVAETMDSSGYTYLLLDAPEGKIWVAIPQTPIKKGQEVTCLPGMTMKNFVAKSLNRTFDVIVFSPGLEKSKNEVAAAEEPKAAEGKEGAAGFDAALQAEHKEIKAPAANGNEPPAMGPSPGSAGAVVPSAAVNVNKASGPNSYSVSECFDQGKDLNGKTVRVRGKVMKISRMIMGKNWLHIQDGTGNPLKNHHDLVATTTADVSEGAIVTVEGVLSAERDFGAGYKYEVLVEDAKIEK